MLKALVSYSKKVPVPGADFSSQGYSLSLETEIPETEPVAIQAKLRATFEMVKASVESELANGRPRTLGAQVPATASTSSQQQPAANGPVSTKSGTSGPVKASNAQVKFILDLGKQQGKGLSDINSLCKEEFNMLSVYDLNKREASTLLNMLKAGPRKAA